MYAYTTLQQVFKQPSVVEDIDPVVREIDDLADELEALLSAKPGSLLDEFEALDPDLPSKTGVAELIPPADRCDSGHEDEGAREAGETERTDTCGTCNAMVVRSGGDAGTSQTPHEAVCARRRSLACEAISALMQRDATATKRRGMWKWKVYTSTTEAAARAAARVRKAEEVTRMAMEETAAAVERERRDAQEVLMLQRHIREMEVSG